jgi:hypothetical protein
MLNVGSPHTRMSKRIDRIILEISAVSIQAVRSADTSIVEFDPSLLMIESRLKAEEHGHEICKLW